MIKWFFYLHLTGLVLISIGLVLLYQPRSTETMLWVAICLGLGLLMVSPYPVIKAIQWMQNNS